MSVKISVIIPVYNVERYVKRCIYSLLNQTFTDFEALVVDDGSTDNSGVILDELQYEDVRLKIFHLSNSGVSSARNFAIERAEGDFFCFLDSDDTYEPEMLEMLLKEQETNQTDLVVSSYSYCYEDSRQKQNVDCGFEGVCNKNKAMWLMVQPHGYRCYLVTKLFKKNLVKKCGAILSFRSKLRMMEDMVFVVEYVERCQSVSFINKSGYNYLMRANSAIHTLNKVESIKAFEIVLPFMKQHFDDKCNDAMRWTYYVALLGYAKEFVKDGIFPPEQVIRNIAVERNHFIWAQKYSLKGYLKHLWEELELRCRLLFVIK